jgi:TPR repeat protein
MKSAWKVVVPVACVALICAAGYLLWKRANEHRAAAAFAACRVKAEQGDAKSQYGLGRMYFYGLGVPKDLAASAEWFGRAAQQGFAPAESQFGNAYYYGLGVDRDFDAALLWYHKAADQGDPIAEDSIGNKYFYGSGVAKDYAQALHWYQLSADQGHASGEANLGDMYLHGFGVQQNATEARLWFRKAADQGNAYAQEMLGLRELRPGYLLKSAVAVELTGSLLLLFGGLGNLFLGKSRGWNLGRVAGLLGLVYGG